MDGTKQQQQTEDDDDEGNSDDCSFYDDGRYRTECFPLSFFFYAELKGQKLGDMQANSKNVADITVSTTQCLYVVR